MFYHANCRVLLPPVSICLLFELTEMLFQSLWPPQLFTQTIAGNPRSLLFSLFWKAGEFVIKRWKVCQKRNWPGSPRTSSFDYVQRMELPALSSANLVITQSQPRFAATYLMQLGTFSSHSFPTPGCVRGVVSVFDQKVPRSSF